jgi:hypothetical protein
MGKKKYTAVSKEELKKLGNIVAAEPVKCVTVSERFTEINQSSMQINEFNRQEAINELLNSLKQGEPEDYGGVKGLKKIEANMQKMPDIELQAELEIGRQQNLLDLENEQPDMVNLDEIDIEFDEHEFDDSDIPPERDKHEDPNIEEQDEL